MIPIIYIRTESERVSYYTEILDLFMALCNTLLFIKIDHEKSQKP